MIDPAELKIETWPRRENKGGQQVSLTETGVKVIHIPTGIEACVKSQRSQYRCRNVAIRMIEAALTDPEFR